MKTIYYKREAGLLAAHINIEIVNSMKDLLLIFFMFSFAGWIWEIVLEIIKTGVFLNRGMFHGPWLPIYGVGGVLMLVLLNGLRQKPYIVFLAGFVLSGIVEYIGSFVLETLFHARWWDYSSSLMNIHGRVCLAGLLLFAAAGCFIIYYLAPFLKRILNRLSQNKKAVLVNVLCILFLADLLISFASPNYGTGISYAL